MIAGRPAFDWELEPPNGMGRGGGYLKHLRERGYVRPEKTMAEMVDDLVRKYRLSVTSGYRTVGTVTGRSGPTDPAERRRWKDAMFFHHYGSGPALDFVSDTKEEPMKTSINITIEAEKLSDLVNALLDINETDGIEITAVDETGVGAAVKDAIVPTPEPEDLDPGAPRMFPRVRWTAKNDINRYLSKAISQPTLAPDMEITYVSDITGERTIRKARPFDYTFQNGRKMFYVTDLRRGGTRSFYLDKIERVEGPAL